MLMLVRFTHRILMLMSMLMLVLMSKSEPALKLRREIKHLGSNEDMKKVFRVSEA